MGRTFRLIEWDLETSPQEPNGDMVSVQVRQGQLTRHGIRECIAKTYGLASPKSVKQYAHFFQVGLRVFYERIDTKETIGKLDEGDIIVWTRVCALHSAVAPAATCPNLVCIRPRHPLHPL